MRQTRRPRAGTLLAAALACALAAAPCTNARAQEDSISSTWRALRRVDGEAIVSKIPPEVRALLTRLKQQLLDLVERTLDAEVSASTPTRTARARVLAALAREGVGVGEPPDDVHTFGSVYPVELTRPRGHDDLLALTVTLSVHCGSDSSLYLFRREGARWRLVLADEADGYEDVTGAQGRFGFVVSPPDSRGRFFVVAADVNPWCTSFWQRVRYRVMRVGVDAYDPRSIARGEETIYLGTALEGFRLAATSRTFTLRFDAGQSLDPGRLTRAHVLKFEVTGGRAERIAPLAFKPEEFADEWAQLKWDEAERWSEPSRLAELGGWHARLNREGEGFSGSEILFVRPCGGAGRSWLVGVESYRDEGDTRTPPRVYFNVSREGGAFIMRAVGDSPARGCDGEPREPRRPRPR
jgi:hypothetical protein